LINEKKLELIFF